MIVARHQKANRLIGMGIRSIKPLFVNGQKMDIGYLSGLKLESEYRNSLYLGRGYQKLKTLHQDNEAPFYLTTIVKDNNDAKILTSGRKILPCYYDVGQIKSLAVSLSKIRRVKSNGVRIKRAAHEDIPRLVRFLNEEGKKRQFFPVYSENDFLPQQGLLQGISNDDIFIAYNDHEIVGVAAAWDQTAFRRTIVAGYSKWLSYTRPLYNAWARISGVPSLPSVGSFLNYFYLSLVCIKDDDLEIFSNIISEIAVYKKQPFMMVGMHENDPLISAFTNIPHHQYLSQLYVVFWEDGEQLISRLDNRCPYIELGSL